MKPSKEIFRDSIALLKKSLGKLIILTLITMALVIVVRLELVPLVVLIGTATMHLLQNSAVALVLVMIVGTLLVLAFLFFYYWILIASKVAPIVLLAKVDAGEAPLIKESYKVGFKKSASYLWVTILMTFAITPFAYLLFIPAIFVAIYLGYALYANVLDDKKGLQALAYSHSLIKGRFWTVVKKTLYPIGWILLPLVGVLILGLLVFFASFHISSTAIIVSEILFVGIPGLIWILYTGLIIFTYTFSLYKELKQTAPVLASENLPETTSAPVTTGSLPETLKEPVSNPILTVPTWIKVSTWIGFGLTTLFVIAIILLFIFSPAFRQGFTEGQTSARGESSLTQTNSKLSADGTENVFDAYGVTFSYPKAYLSVPTDPKDNASVAHLIDTSKKEKEDYPHVSVMGYILDDEYKSKVLPDIVKEMYLTDIEKYKKSGEISSYEMTNGTTTAGQSVIYVTVNNTNPDTKKEVFTDTAFLKFEDKLIMITGECLTEEKSKTIETVNKIAESLMLKIDSE